MSSNMKPTLLITLGDVAGVGPEIVARGWADLVKEANPVVVGDPGWVERGAKLTGVSINVHEVASVHEAQPSADCIPCLHATKQDLSRVISGKVCAEAGRAAYDFLIDAI